MGTSLMSLMWFRCPMLFLRPRTSHAINLRYIHLYSLLWMLDSVPNGHIASITNSIIRHCSSPWIIMEVVDLHVLD